MKIFNSGPVSGEPDSIYPQNFLLGPPLSLFELDGPACGLFLETEALPNLHLDVNSAEQERCLSELRRSPGIHELLNE